MIANTLDKTKFKEVDPRLGVQKVTFAILLSVLLISGGALQAEAINPLVTDNEVDYNLLAMKGGLEVRLPAMPRAGPELENFLRLSPEERQSFYIKRNFLLRLLAGGLARPGLRYGLHWVRDKVRALRAKALGRLSPARVPAKIDEGLEDGPLELDWNSLPTDLSIERKAYIENTISQLIDSMWESAPEIASASGLGMTYVGGLIYNTSLPIGGYVFGRSLSIDIGMDFKAQEGYIRFLYDRQTLKTPGMSFDVGAMLDVLIHITNTELPAGSEIEATHVKLPVIGCFRYGAEYKAWGAQFGVSLVELVGAWLSYKGVTSIGPAMIVGSRIVGAMTVYSTSLQRRVLQTYRVPVHLLPKLGLRSLVELSKNLNQAAEISSCERALER